MSLARAWRTLTRPRDPVVCAWSPNCAWPPTRVDILEAAGQELPRLAGTIYSVDVGERPELLLEKTVARTCSTGRFYEVKRFAQHAY